jgi:hypothetical protein
MWHLEVVGLDEERDQGPKAFDVVEGVEVEPLLLEGAPPSLDDGVRVADLDLREDAMEAGCDEGGDERQLLLPVDDNYFCRSRSS